MMIMMMMMKFLMLVVNLRTYWNTYATYILFPFVVDATIINTQSISICLSRSSIANITEIKWKEKNSKENYLKPQFYFHASLFFFLYFFLFFSTPLFFLWLLTDVLCFFFHLLLFGFRFLMHTSQLPANFTTKKKKTKENPEKKNTIQMKRNVT